MEVWEEATCSDRVAAGSGGRGIRLPRQSPRLTSRLQDRVGRSAQVGEAGPPSQAIPGHAVDAGLGRPEGHPRRHRGLVTGVGMVGEVGWSRYSLPS